MIHESLETPIQGYYDAVVVGAGPAGCGAAIALGRSGMKTLILDRYNCLGGSWTTGFMNPLFDFKNKTGIVGELVSELKERNQFGGFGNMSFNYEYMKRILNEKCRKPMWRFYIIQRILERWSNKKEFMGSLQKISVDVSLSWQK